MNTHQTNNFIYGGYVRKSSESEDRQVQSIERQKDDLLSIIEKERIILNDEIIEETKSAFSIGREGFNNLIKLTEKGKINAWLCWHPNRLSRNPMDAGIIIYLLDIGKLHHIKTPSRVFYNTPTDKMMLQFEFMMSKKDSDDKSHFVKSGLRKRYEKGYPSGRAPIGFLNNKTQEQGDRGWIIDQDRIGKLRLLFTRFLKGNDSLNTITEYARNNLYLTTPIGKRSGGKLVARSVIHSVLTNPIYAGFFYSRDEKGNSKSLRKLEKSLPRIISENEHIQILNIFRKHYHPKLQKHNTAYKGYIVGGDGNTIGADIKFQLICDCGKKFAYRSKETCPQCGIEISKMKSPKYLSYTYYFNIKRRKTRGYSAKGIEQKKIDTFLIDFYNKELKLSKKEYEWAKKHLKILRDKEFEEDKRLVELHNSEIKSLEAKKEKLRKLFIEEMISLDEFKDDVSKLETQLSIKKSEKIYAENWYEQLDKLLDNLYCFEDIIKKADYNDKKQLLKLLRSNLVWDEEKLFINKADWLKEYTKGRKIILEEFKEFEPENISINKGLNSTLEVYCPFITDFMDKLRNNYCKKSAI
ncbi:recombinase family protein [uncultured Dokdonia sp.]|uniref:recombinase family protein n=1 Tax=uncultured Dokdonia sp. TaxID=575653 RepID=UPI00261485D2|nr:recombinase family protein [uncultured Dokdonia sp.]